MDTLKILNSPEKGKLTFLKGKASAFLKSLTKYDDVPQEIPISDALYFEGAFIAVLEFRGGGV